jgi:hypothetical protein
MRNTPIFESLEKSKKDLLNMYGSQITPQQKDHVQWATTKMPNENWSMWTVRAHRANPAQFTPEVKEKIEHFAGSQHIPEVAKVRFDKTHDLDSGMKVLEGAEGDYNKRIGGKLNIVTPDENTVKVLDVGDGKAWYSLGRGSCSAEGKAMGHCGNVPSEKPGDRVLSLRTEHKGAGSQTFHEPHATFIVNGGYLGEMKGRGNTKPAQRYHKAIADLLLHPKIKGIVGGGYLHHQNFNIDDLEPEQKLRVLLAKPNISVYNNDEVPADLPEKFDKEVKPVIEYKNKLKQKTSNTDQNQMSMLDTGPTNWRQALIEDIRNGKGPKMAMNAIGNPTDDELHSIISGPKTQRDARIQASMSGRDTAKLHSALASLHPEDVSYLNNPNIDAILNTNNSKAIENLSGNDSLSEKDIDYIVNHPKFSEFPSEAHQNLLRHDEKLNPKHHEKFLNSPHEEVRTSLASTTTLDPKIQDKLADDTSGAVRSNLAEYGKNLSPEVQNKLYAKGHLSSLAQNKNLDPEIANKIADYALSNDPNTVKDRGELISNLLYNDNLPASVLDKFSRINPIESESTHYSVLDHNNLDKETFNQIFNRHSSDPTYMGRHGYSLMANKHLSPEQFKKLKTMYGRQKAWSGAFKQHPMYHAKDAELTPLANQKMLANHMNRLKSENPEKHANMQDKLISSAIESGHLGPVKNLIESGALDDDHHKKLHDQLEEVNAGDHEHSPNQKWDSDDYNKMLKDTLVDPTDNIPTAHHNEMLNRLEQEEYPDDIRDHVFQHMKDKDSLQEEIRDAAEADAMENNTMDEHLDDMERENRRGNHPLDTHISNAEANRGNKADLSELNDVVENRAIESLKAAGKVDAEGNYNDDDYDTAIEEAKDSANADLRSYITNGTVADDFSSDLETQLERYRERIDEYYRDSISEDAYNNGYYDDAEDKIRNKMFEDPDYWPKHLRDTDWLKNQIKENKEESPKGKDNSNHDEFGIEKSDTLDKYERLAKAAMSNKNKMAIAQSLASIQAQQDQIQQLQQTNPEAYKSILDLTQTLVDLFKEVNGEPIDGFMHELEVQQAMPQQSQGQPPQAAQPNQEKSLVPPQDKKITHGSRELPIGAIRNYDPKTQREKSPDGEWISAQSGTKTRDWQS